MKANGYDAVSIYVDWNYHSPEARASTTSPACATWTSSSTSPQRGRALRHRPTRPVHQRRGRRRRLPGLADHQGRHGAHQRRDLPALRRRVADRSRRDHRPAPVHRRRRHGRALPDRERVRPGTTAGRDYMEHLYTKVRADGITVPLFHNDKGRNGYWMPGSFTPAGEPGRTSTASTATPLSPSDPGTAGTRPTGATTAPAAPSGGSTASPNTPGFDGRVRRRLVRPVGRRGSAARATPAPRHPERGYERGST